MQPIKDQELELDLVRYLNYKDKRIYIFYLLLRYTAFRASDILPLRVRDVQGDYIVIREKKTENRINKEQRKILIHPDLKEELNIYTKDKNSWEVLFLSNKGNNKALSYTQAYRILKKASEVVGIKNFGTHSGRKTCAYNIYKESGDLQEVKTFLMHDDSRDTARYVGIEEEVRDNSIKKINGPLAVMKRRGIYK